MARKRRDNPQITDFIIKNVMSHPGDIASLTAKQFSVSRVTANRYLDRLVMDGLLTATGQTKARKYILRDYVDEFIHFDVTPRTEEDVIWRERISPLLQKLPQNVLEICQYGVNEMVNNVIDHSGSKDCLISLSVNAARVLFIIRDHGVGIFEKIQKDCGLDDPRHALLELSKGKLTTDPSKHTGEGIFFTSRMFHSFQIISGELSYLREMEDNDEWLIEVADKKNRSDGTGIFLNIKTDATYTARDVFRRYENDDHGFAKTHVPVRLARYDTEQLVSRSQARRVLARFNRFTEVLLDFDGVPRIGQAFADEIFRVYKNEHPQVQIFPVRTSSEVREVIDHVIAGKPVQNLLPLSLPRKEDR